MRARIIAVLFLAGCSSSPESQVAKTYDLGVAAPRIQLPALKSVSVRAPMPFDGTDMFYRLAWRDGAEVAAFSNSRWSAPPADLVRRQLLRALPATSAAPCALEVELQDFSQVFSSKDASEARLELRAAIVAGNSRIATRGVSVAEPNAGANAAAGAAAFARAADRAVSDLANWIASQPACRT